MSRPEYAITPIGQVSVGESGFMLEIDPAFRPGLAALEGFSHLDGVLIDCTLSEIELIDWQDRFANLSDDLPGISFSQIPLQQRWLKLTAPQEYVDKMLAGI